MSDTIHTVKATDLTLDLIEQALTFSYDADDAVFGPVLATVRGWRLRPEMRAFMEHNTDSVAGLDAETLEGMETFAQHHAGGMFVLLRETEAGVVKMHDTWGPGPEHVNPGEVDGPIVVHHYDPDADQDDDPRMWVASFDSAAQAFRLFTQV